MTDAIAEHKRWNSGYSTQQSTRPLRRWVERLYPNLIYWNEPAKGGHFAAWEEPESFVREMRGWAAALRAC